MIEQPVSRALLVFGFLGGAIAWGARFIIVSVGAEWACGQALGAVQIAGLNIVSLSLLLVSFLFTAIACGAVYAAFRSEQFLRAHPLENERMRGAGHFMARGGLILSALFVFIMLVETIPIFFFLEHC